MKADESSWYHHYLHPLHKLLQTFRSTTLAVNLAGRRGCVDCNLQLKVKDFYMPEQMSLFCRSNCPQKAIKFMDMGCVHQPAQQAPTGWFVLGSSSNCTQERAVFCPINESKPFRTLGYILWFDTNLGWVFFEPECHCVLN